MTKGLNEQVEEFRNRSLAKTVYPVLWVDALCEKVRVDGRMVRMAALQGVFMRNILAYGGRKRRKPLLPR